MTEHDMHRKIKNKVHEYMGMFYEHFEGKTIFPIGYPDIDFAELGNEAGNCQYQCDENYVEGLIRFNVSSIPLNFKRYINYIVGHEVAHWCHAILFGHIRDEDNEGHKGTWKQMMEFFDVEAVEYLNPFHCAPIKGLHQWKCGCSSVNFIDEEHSEAQEWGCECENCKQDYVYHGVNK